MKTKSLSKVLLPLSLAAFFLSTPAFGAQPKVHFEDDCWAIFGAHSVGQLEANETKVDEKESNVHIKQTVVTESRDGVIVDTFIRISCSPAE